MAGVVYGGGRRHRPGADIRRAQSAPAGSAVIAALAQQAAGRIVVMPGGGITPDNAGALLRSTGAVELQAACRAVCAEDGRLVALGFGCGPQLQPAVVRALVDAVRLP